MEFRNTKHQVPRGARPDAETGNRIMLIKPVSEMRATYQVRLLAFLASSRGKELVIEVPQHCRIHHSLRMLVNLMPGVVTIART